MPLEPQALHRIFQALESLEPGDRFRLSLLTLRSLLDSMKLRKVFENVGMLSTVDAAVAALALAVEKTEQHNLELWQGKMLADLQAQYPDAEIKFMSLTEFDKYLKSQQAATPHPPSPEESVKTPLPPPPSAN